MTADVRRIVAGLLCAPVAGCATAARSRVTTGARQDRQVSDPAVLGVICGRMLLSGKRLGFAAILFFTVKGLLWLIVPFVVYKWGC